MAITGKPFFNAWDTPDVNVEEFAIGGKMLIAQYEIDEMSVQKSWGDESWRDEVRKKLANEIANKILTDKFCEVTSHKNLLNGNTIINARCYLAPNEQVKVLRSLKR